MASPYKTVPLGERDHVDFGALAAFLAAHGEDVGGGGVDVSRFPGGHSNLTYLLSLKNGRDLVLRAPPPGAHTVSGHDMLREAKVMRALRSSCDKVPRVVAICDDVATSPLGAPFFVMEAQPGLILRHKAPSDVTLDVDVMRRLTTALCDELSGLHRIDASAPEIAALGKPEGYVQRQVDGWCARYEKARTDDVSDIDAIMAWLKKNVPQTPSGPPTVVHNDFKLDNVVVDNDDVTRVVSILDWELATVGEPLTDLGTTLAYWVQADDGDDVKALPMGLTHLPGALSRLEVAARWEQQTGREAKDLLFYYVLASFKVAVIAQQIYARYARGFSTDPRFAMLGFAVAVIAAKTTRALEKGSIA
jgi:aminoglycoside phosphotransferase (APT) family kinase protein